MEYSHLDFARTAGIVLTGQHIKVDRSVRSWNGAVTTGNVKPSNRDGLLVQVDDPGKGPRWLHLSTFTGTVTFPSGDTYGCKPNVNMVGAVVDGYYTGIYGHAIDLNAVASGLVLAAASGVTYIDVEDPERGSHWVPVSMFTGIVKLANKQEYFLKSGQRVPALAPADRY